MMTVHVVGVLYTNHVRVRVIGIEDWVLGHIRDPPVPPDAQLIKSFFESSGSLAILYHNPE